MSKRVGQFNLSELPLLFAVFLDLVGFGMAFPDIQIRAEGFAKAQGIAHPGWIIGLLLSSYFVVQMISSPQWGKLSDRIGRKPVLLTCTILSALSMLTYSFAENLWLVLGSRVLAGLAAANVVVAQAYVADTSTDEDRAQRQGRVSAALLFGLVAGPAIGGELAHLGGNELLGYVAAIASGLSAICILLFVPHLPVAEERRPGKRPVFDLSLLRESPALRGIVVFASAGWFVLACLEGTFGRLISLIGFGQREFGIIFSYESLLAAAMGVLLGAVVRRFSSNFILRVSYVLQALGVALMPLAPGLAILFLASTLYAVGAGFANPVVSTVSSALAPPDRQGEVFGLLQSSRSFGFLVGPTLGGVMFDWHPGAPYYFAACVALLVAFLIKVPETARVGAI